MGAFILVSVTQMKIKHSGARWYLGQGRPQRGPIPDVRDMPEGSCEQGLREQDALSPLERDLMLDDMYGRSLWVPLDESIC